MTKETGESSTTEALLRSVDLLVRLKISEIKGSRTQKEMIHLLSGMGAKSTEIASLLGVSVTTVAPLVSKLKSGAKPKAARAAKKRAV